ncbi:2-oxoacid dehydrogenases acyltransferase-domain-containing protein [Dactylonectria macrodidyma]|uniref:Dihydrolipoamide acetyltransferase component of pyruvate dehydrogenase complex n=1 Tax=Dactylonectria macrodidyma TaxID=307937 RepID=A0A9P9J4P8_9HYPO|nr:2-oxoacid dehydrogenases acyltransferase-domain-containing protein [Dactylonectria macrodidyma]
MLTLRQKGLAAVRTLPSRCRVVSPGYGLVNSGLQHHRWFGKSPALLALKPYLLADIGEGITECQIISWAVKPGDKVDQFDPICEVQSDKASVEITSRFEGTIEKLHYQEGDVAKVGSALLDMDVSGESDDATETSESGAALENDARVQKGTGWDSQLENVTASPSSTASKTPVTNDRLGYFASNGSQAPVAPAVRRILKENNLNVGDVQGTGKDGRVLKEDVLRHIEAHTNFSTKGPQPSDVAADSVVAQDRRVSLSPVQSQMFKSMTSSLAIPHFLYTHSVNLTPLTKLREKLRADPSLAPFQMSQDDATVKFTLLPFVLKALSLAVSNFPMMNSVLDVGKPDSGQRPELVIKRRHNFGIAVDTSNGLLVPVVHNVQSHSVLSLAAEISRLGKLAREGKLTTEDMKGGTLVVSNIGSIGGNVVAPIILSPMTAIMAVGKTEDIPVFETDQDGNERIVKKKQAVLSWSADHRVIDGATVAKCAQQVAMWLEKPEAMGVALK